MSGHKKYLSVALLSAVLLPAMASAADAPATFTAEQEAQIGKIAADYLVAHPEVLLQASQKLQQIQAEQQASAATQAVLKNAALLTQDKNTPTYGPANGKVTVIEFFDYQCVYCSRLAPVMEQVIIAHPQTRFAFKEWPIFGGRWESSLEAAKTGLQIYQQKGADAYLAYHNGIYATGHNEGKLTTADIQQQAKKAGFDAKKANDVEPVLQSINDLAQEIGLSGTPGVIVMPTTGATEASITVFPGLADKASLEAAIKKAGG
ncbi:DsbA family protein [Klebsiella sp. GB_Kp056]|uniref:DsbA family protein n=1 Tax=Klebsiella sp. GB_Kp056 TaxID=3153405 RepID=UPI0032B3CC37